jgi:hypothetical protein
MNRHGTMRKKEEVAELTATEFRSLLLNSLNKLNNRDTVKNGFDELISIIRDLSPEDDSLNIFMVTPSPSLLIFFELHSRRQRKRHFCIQKRNDATYRERRERSWRIFVNVPYANYFDYSQILKSTPKYPRKNNILGQRYERSRYLRGMRRICVQIYLCACRFEGNFYRSLFEAFFYYFNGTCKEISWKFLIL